MNKKPLFVAFSTQKGGVGKTTFTVLAASYLHYLTENKILVVDCDYPQYSASLMRKRDIKEVNKDKYYQELALNQFNTLNKKAYPILQAKPETALDVINSHIQKYGQEYDIIFIDLPGTVHSAGVITTLSSIDYIFTPIVSDYFVLSSSLSFANVIHKNFFLPSKTNLKGIYLFWNMVRSRERTHLYDEYNIAIQKLGLPLLETKIPDMVRFRKEINVEQKAVFRSTLFPVSDKLMKGSNLPLLMDEILNIIKQ